VNEEYHEIFKEDIKFPDRNANFYLLKKRQECQPSAAMIGEWRSKERHDKPYKNERDSHSHGMQQQCGMAVGTMHYCDRNACFLPSVK
jgi:hypothetical protein